MQVRQQPRVQEHRGGLARHQRRHVGKVRLCGEREVVAERAHQGQDGKVGMVGPRSASPAAAWGPPPSAARARAQSLRLFGVGPVPQMQAAQAPTATYTGLREQTGHRIDVVPGTLG